MSTFSSILPGARVRSPDGFLGTVERLARQDGQHDGPPDVMFVRSDDGQWRYALPLFLVTDIAQDMLHPVVNVGLPANELPYYIVERLHESRPAPAAGARTSGDEDADLVVPVATEELVAQKRPAQIGTVHIRKGVESIEQQMTVPVYREQAVVERIPAEHYDGSAPTDPNEVIIPVLEERLVVQKQAVITEYVRVRKQLITDQRTIAGTVRRETVSVLQTRLDEPGASGAVEPAEQQSGNAQGVTPPSDANTGM